MTSGARLVTSCRLVEIPARVSQAGATDFASVAEEWLQRDQAKNRTREHTKRALEREVLPHWGHRNIGDIGRRDVLD